jgi:FAD:protein FMN transferase
MAPCARLSSGQSTAGYRHSIAVMGTIVTIHVLGDADGVSDSADTDVTRAFDWFREIEACCNRFDPASEIRRLTDQVGVAVPVSAALFEALRFALTVAEESGGAFDPTIGHRMEARGFNRDYRTGELVETGVAADATATYRDVLLDADRHTVTLQRPLVLDLGAVAKGLAIDMAARELKPFANYAVDAGGDLYLGGKNSDGDAWSVGVRHPRQDNQILETVRVSDAAVCTSGDYERRGPGAGGHHILDPRRGETAVGAASVTVIASTAIVADALATCAFVLGPDEGLRLLEQQGVDGLIVSPALDRYATPGWSRYLA